MDLRMSEMRKVTLLFLEGDPHHYLIPADQVDRFVEASKRLHWKPGRNPHSGLETSKIWRIAVSELECRGPYWWTVPDLQENGDPAGAQIIDEGRSRVVWSDEEYLARCEAEEAESEARHWREREQAAREQQASA